MSGGSYNYTYEKLLDYYSNTPDKELNLLIKDLSKLLHDLEWWQSGDYNKEQYEKTAKWFKEKWLSKYTKDKLEKCFVHLIAYPINTECPLCKLKREL